MIAKSPSKALFSHVTPDYVSRGGALCFHVFTVSFVHYSCLFFLEQYDIIAVNVHKQIL